MIIEIFDNILPEFLQHHTLEAVFLDFNNNEVKRVIVKEFLPSFYFDSFTTATFKGRNRKLEFRRNNYSTRIEQLGVITMTYELRGEG